jgi:hypothetical protein
MTPTSGPNSPKPTTAQVVGGVYNAAGESLVDGQASALQQDSTGKLLVVATVTPSGTQDVNIADVKGAAPALNNPLPVELSDGTNALGVVGNPLQVGGTLAAVTSITNQVDTNLKQVGGANTVTAASGVQKVGVVGNAGAAFDAPATGTAPANVVYQGSRAATTYPTAATDGQIVAQMADKAGRIVTAPNAPRDLVGTSVLSNNSSASGASLIGAGSTGVFNDIITLVITNRSSTATVVSLTDGTNTYTFAIAGNGGLVCNFSTPLPAASSATAWTIGNSATVACDYMTVYAKNK